MSDLSSASGGESDDSIETYTYLSTGRQLRRLNKDVESLAKTNEYLSGTVGELSRRVDELQQEAVAREARETARAMTEAAKLERYVDKKFDELKQLIQKKQRQ